jgi:hypothetical protein
VRIAARNLLLALALTLMASLSSAAQPVTRISALASGQILLNGQPTSLAALEIALAELKSQNGVVWYYRENARDEPPPEAMQAIQLVVKHGLPVSMSTKPDFSDVVDANGVSQPRKP